MKIYLLLFIFSCFSFNSWAQKDRPFKVAKFKLEWDVPSTNNESALNLPSIEYKSILKQNDSYLKKYSVLKKENQKTSVLETKTDFKTLGDEYKQKLNKEINKGSAVDVFFGKFIVETPRIKIRTRDFATPDGDRVRIILDGVTLVENIYLENAFKEHYIDLKEGDNLLDILALNQGLEGPNTATFEIYDDAGNLITANDWNLNTGLAAKFLLVYRKPLEKK